MFHELLVETLQMHAKLLRKVRRSFLGELLNQWLQLGVGYLMRSSRLQPDGRVINIVGAPREFQRKVDIGILPSEPRGHHAHDRISLVDQRNLAAHHRRVAVVMATLRWWAARFSWSTRLIR